MIRTEADIADALAVLHRLDERLARVSAIAGTVPLRRGAGGLEGLAGTVVAQQVSKASADAIFRRLRENIDIKDPRAILTADDAAFRLAGLSGAKQRTLLAIAEAMEDGRLDFRRIEAAEPADAVAELVAVKGIGPWTAQCYLLFSAGHPDIFPVGDLALRLAVAHAYGLEGRPNEKSVAAIAALWSPHRSVAARLFWSYYGAVMRRDAAPVEPSAG